MLSCVMITFEEHERLQVTLPPILEACDELVVVDMGSSEASVEAVRGMLRPCDRLVDYPRDALFRFGFAHARNYAAGFASHPWIIVIDSDEFASAASLDAVKDVLKTDPDKCYSVIRRNYEFRNGCSLSDIPSLIQHAPYTEERHVRIYPNNKFAGYRGLIHEEVWMGTRHGSESCAPTNLVLHHLSSYGSRARDNDKEYLYSYLLIFCYTNKGFRLGTNDWFFKEYIPRNFERFWSDANKFASENNLDSTLPKISPLEDFNELKKRFLD